jgi:hypothetical protein
VKHLLTLLLASTLIGCGTANIRDDYKLDTASGEGLVIGSITYDGAMAEYRINYEREGGGTRNYFSAGAAMYPAMPRNDFPTNSFRGALFSSALPAGRYLIRKSSTSGGMVNSHSTNPETIAFEVAPGKATYLGNFHFVPVRRFNILIGAKVIHLDQLARDQSVFHKRYPALTNTPIKTIEIRNGGLGEPVKTEIQVITPGGAVISTDR